MAIALEPGSAESSPVTVCAVAGDESDVASTLAAVLAHTPEGVPVYRAVAGRGPICVRGPDGGVPNSTISVPTVGALLGAGDLALVRAPCHVGAEWLDGLRRAAHADVDIAAAAALEAPAEPHTAVDPHTAGDARRDHEGVTDREMMGPAGSCVYLRASAAALIGELEPGPDWERAARARGLRVMLAAAVIVRPGAISQASTEPAVRSARAAMRRAAGQLSVIIDARSLAQGRVGTRTHTLELLAALAAHRPAGLTVTALIPDPLDGETRRRLAGLGGIVWVAVAAGAALPTALRADVMHRPYQVASDADVVAMRAIATRTVVTHQDLISYRRAEYFSDDEAFDGYRRMTEHALSLVDGVLCFSDHVRRQAIAEGLVEASRCRAIGFPLAVAGAESGAAVPRAPAAADGAAGAAGFLLCLGTDYMHKNRPFAIAIHRELRERHGWAGQLLFAGPHMRWGSSQRVERAALEADPALGASVRDLGPVSDAEREWLIREAALVLYPTLQEGFGLVPFEAAQRGRPCLWAAGTSLREFLPDSEGGIVPWDAAASAAAAARLIHDPQSAARQAAAIARAAAALTPERFAEELVAAYTALGERPAVAPAAGALRSEDAARLLGPGGLLPSEAERPLLALAARERLARAVFGAASVAYRIGRSLTRAAGRRSRQGREAL